LSNIRFHIEDAMFRSALKNASLKWAKRKMKTQKSRVP